MAILGVVPGSASADPKPTIQDVKKKADELNKKVDLIVEQYNQARIDLADAKHRMSIVQRHVNEEKRKLDKLHGQMGQMASAAYRSGGLDSVVALLGSSDPQKFLDRAASLNQISRSRNAQLTEYEAEAARLAQQRIAAKRVLGEQTKIEDKLAKQKETIEEKVAEQTKLLRSLQREVARTTGSYGEAYTGPASGPVRDVLSYAYAQLGKPYQWGAAGPGAFDCSGLTMRAWEQAGVSLPHSSAAQYNAGPHVNRSDLQPGDLVFFGSPIHHVGIYIGNDMMIHAPHTGDVVKQSNINESWYASEYVGAVRP